MHLQPAAEAVPATETTPAIPAKEETLFVEPGLALDRIGRLIEVPRVACLRLDRWYQGQTPDALREALHPDDPFGGVIVDLFVRFTVCEFGKTPAFASGPFDATEAIRPSKLRDWYSMDLILRKEKPLPPLPKSQWPDVTALSDPERALAIQDAVFGAWPSSDATHPNPEAAGEYADGQTDKTAVFLARIILPAVASEDATERPVRQDAAAQPVRIEFTGRQFAYPARFFAAQLKL